MRDLDVIAAAHPGRTGASSDRRRQDPHACITIALLAQHGITPAHLPSGCAIQDAPAHIRTRFTQGALWLLKRLHHANHRGAPWGALPDFAARLFAKQKRR